MATRKKPAPAPAPALLEWAMGGLGLLIVLAVLTVIGLEAVGAREPARLEARIGETRLAGANWLAEVEVRNLGGETAAALDLHGRQTATLVFDSDPRAATVSVSGWSEP